MKTNQIIRGMLCLLLLCVLPRIGFGQSAKDAVKALKRLEARVQVGTSYRDYSPALGEARLEVNLFVEGQEAKNNPVLANRIERVEAHYEIAGTLWKMKVERDRNFIYLSESDALKLLTTYPEANKYVNEGGVLHKFPEVKVNVIGREETLGGTAIVIDALLPIIWNAASKELKEASRLLSDK